MSCGNVAFLERAMAAADDMLKMANAACVELEDDGCVVVCGIVRDSAHQIKASAERELKRLRGQLGWSAIRLAAGAGASEPAGGAWTQA
jgi:hypothetical protein